MQLPQPGDSRRAFPAGQFLDDGPSVGEDCGSQGNLDRRGFLAQSLAGSLAAGVIGQTESLFAASNSAGEVTQAPPNMIGAYGPWAASIVGDAPALHSFRSSKFNNIDSWRSEGRRLLRDYLLQPNAGPISDLKIDRQEEADGLHIEHISWQLPYGPRTRALFLKPAKSQGRLPAVLGLHDHGGNKFFGYEKITKSSSDVHPIMVKHQADAYGGVPWANELAKRGFAVLVHDTYTFASRRVRMADLTPQARRNADPVDSNPVASSTEESIVAYNRFAADHEHLMAKSLFCAGLTWPGIFVEEDQRALDYLCSRSDVQVDRVGCAGLSGGGLRTVYLGGLDERIRCACCVGMMTTWRDYLLHKCYTHTWMIYIPGLPRHLDYPEVLALRAPLPTMVLNNNEDSLFTLPEMKRADQIMAEVFTKANAREAYRCSFYPGKHKFDLGMQKEAFDWFERWLT